MDRAYYQPSDLKQALSLLAEHPEAAVVAGGTDLVVADRSGKKQLAASLIAIHGLGDLRHIETAENGEMRIGALATHGELEGASLVRGSRTALADAAALVGSPATRHVGTFGGNICNASPAMEVGSPLLVFDAAVELASGNGTRRVPFAEFVTGPGKTTRHSGELLMAALLPPLPVNVRRGTAYLRLQYRQAMEIAIVGAATLIDLDTNDRCAVVRVALTAVAPTCVRARAAEALLEGQHLTADLIQRAANAAAPAAKPIDDVRASADYRRAMVPVIVRRALEIAWRRARGEVVPIPASLAVENLGTTAAELAV